MNIVSMGSNYPFYTYLNSKPPVLPVQDSLQQTLGSTIFVGNIPFLGSITRMWGLSSEQILRNSATSVNFWIFGHWDLTKFLSLLSFNFQLPVDYVPVGYNHPTAKRQ